MEKALETQLKNIETKTGKTLKEFAAIARESGLQKHGELRTMFKEKFELGYGDANSLAHVTRNFDEFLSANEVNAVDAVSEIYAGKSEPLRLVHDAVMTEIEQIGEFEIAPKKKYLSLRRRKQFATVGPGTKGRLEVGLNMKGVEATDRLEALKPGGMCQYRVYLVQPDQVDGELIGWIRTAFESAG